MTQIKDELKNILGEDAFSLGNMQVSDRVRKLVRAVSYLDAQIAMLKKWIEDDAGHDHIDQIQQNLKKILNEK